MAFDPATDAHNVNTTALPGGAPLDLATLKADSVEGDGVYADGTGTGYVFGPWDFVWLNDGSQAFYNRDYDVWSAGVYPPLAPLSGTVRADLDALRLLLGAVSTADDDKLDAALATATEWIYERTMRCDWDHPDVQYAVLLLAARLYQRRKSPEGVAGFGGEGVVVRVLASDPDINRLIERHAEMRTAGIG